NLTLGGRANVDGNLYTPRTGVGSCNAAAANAFTGDLNHVDSIVQLPAGMSYPTPAKPPYVNAATLTPNSGGSMAPACSTFGLSPPKCSVSGNTLVLDSSTGEIQLPEVTFNGGFTLQLVAGTGPNKYDFNSLTLLGHATIQTTATSSSQAAIVNIVGKD